MQMETVAISISLANLVVLCGLVFKAGSVYERFVAVERKVEKLSSGLSHMQLLVQRIADKLGLIREIDMGGEMGD